MFRALILSIGLAVAATPAIAFTPAECSALLEYGIYDEHEVVTTREKFSRLRNQYCKSKESGGGLTIPVYGVPLTASGNSSSNICAENVSEEYEAYFFHETKRTINSNLIDGFNECLAVDRPGVSYVLKTTADPSRFGLTFSYRPSGLVSAKVTALVEGATCQSAAFDGIMKSNERFSFEIELSPVQVSCTRRAEDLVTVTAAVGPGSEITTELMTLPGYKREPEPESFTFHSPGVAKRDGAPKTDDPIRVLDVCTSYTLGCGAGADFGRPAADRWCHNSGFGDAIDFRVRRDTPPSRTIDDRVDCNIATCDRIDRITCERK